VVDYSVEVLAATVAAEGAHTRRAVEVPPPLLTILSVSNLEFPRPRLAERLAVLLELTGSLRYIFALLAIIVVGEVLSCVQLAQCVHSDQLTSNLAYLVITPSLAPQYAQHARLGLFARQHRLCPSSA
jgi:hypothetical protein